MCPPRCPSFAQTLGPDCREWVVATATGPVPLVNINLEMLVRRIERLTDAAAHLGFRLTDILHTLLMRGAAVAQCVLHDFSFEGRLNIARMPSRT